MKKIHFKRDSVTRFSIIFGGLKDSTWAPYEQAKRVSRTFSFSLSFFESFKQKTMVENLVTLSLLLRKHESTMYIEDSLDNMRNVFLRKHRIYRYPVYYLDVGVIQEKSLTWRKLHHFVKPYFQIILMAHTFAVLIFFMKTI